MANRVDGNYIDEFATLRMLTSPRFWRWPMVGGAAIWLASAVSSAFGVVETSAASVGQPFLASAANLLQTYGYATAAPLMVLSVFASAIRLVVPESDGSRRLPGQISRFLGQSIATVVAVAQMVNPFSVNQKTIELVKPTIERNVTTLAESFEGPECVSEALDKTNYPKPGDVVDITYVFDGADAVGNAKTFEETIKVKIVFGEDPHLHLQDNYPFAHPVSVNAVDTYVTDEQPFYTYVPKPFRFSVPGDNSVVTLGDITEAFRPVAFRNVFSSSTPLTDAVSATPTVEICNAVSSFGVNEPQVLESDLLALPKLPSTMIALSGGPVFRVPGQTRLPRP